MKIVLAMVLALATVLGMVSPALGMSARSSLGPVAVIQAAPADIWSIQTIDPPPSNSPGWRTSIAVDSNGIPHIAYYTFLGELKYASWTGTAWDIKLVDQNLGGFDPGLGSFGTFMRASLKLDGANNPRIAYTNNTTGTLKYAYWNGSAFVKETADNTTGVGWYASLALDPAGNPHISYYDETNLHLKYASSNGTAWVTETADNGTAVGKWTSLAIGSDNVSHISYYDETNLHLKYASSNGTAWVTETADSTFDVGFYTSIALDTAGNPHISYYGSPSVVKYVSRIGGSWSAPETVDGVGDTGWWSSLAIGSDNVAHVAYFYPGIYQPGIGYDVSDLKYAVRTGLNSWSIETVDAPGDQGSNCALALDVGGRPHISYQDNTNHALKYATTAWPAVSTLAATGIVTNRATLSGNLTSLGSAPSANVSFEYGLTTSYGSTTAAQPMTGFGVFSANVTSLSTNTTYHFRAKADSGVKGLAYGTDMTFTTRAVSQELVIFRPGGTWFIDTNYNGTYEFGVDWTNSPNALGKSLGDMPVAIDWNGDGRQELAVFRPGGTWFIDTNHNGTYEFGVDLTNSPNLFGKSAGDVPLAIDWNGDGRQEMAIFRPGGTWFIDTNYNGTYEFGVDWTNSPSTLGRSVGDMPVAIDWNGDGRQESAIFRPSTGTWFIDSNRNGAFNPGVDPQLGAFGQTGDMPLAIDWDGNGTQELAIFRPSTATWYIDTNRDGVFTSGVDWTNSPNTFGRQAGDVPLSIKGW